jgi:hypothetical protein
MSVRDALNSGDSSLIKILIVNNFSVIVYYYSSYVVNLVFES